MITLSVLMPGLITEYHKYPAATSENIPFSAFPCAAENAQSDQRIAFSGRKGYNAQSSRREKRKHEELPSSFQKSQKQNDMMK
jgi:hypothetical protein